jgi:hypothetical protein
MRSVSVPNDSCRETSSKVARLIDSSRPWHHARSAYYAVVHVQKRSNIHLTGGLNVSRRTGVVTRSSGDWQRYLTTVVARPNKIEVLRTNVRSDESHSLASYGSGDLQGSREADRRFTVRPHKHARADAISSTLVYIGRLLVPRADDGPASSRVHVELGGVAIRRVNRVVHDVTRIDPNRERRAFNRPPLGSFARTFRSLAGRAVLADVRLVASPSACSRSALHSPRSSVAVHPRSLVSGR